MKCIATENRIVDGLCDIGNGLFFSNRVFRVYRNEFGRFFCRYLGCKFGVRFVYVCVSLAEKMGSLLEGNALFSLIVCI